MMIKKCSICGRLVHESSKCPYCGHENCFIPVENQVRVHKNVKTEYDKLKELIKKEKYTDAIEVSHYVLEWTPTTSEVFWIRLLARNGCKNDAQLIQKGFEYEESADFFNAFKYGSDAEKTVYQEVRKTVEEIRSALADAVRQHEYEEKKATQIVKLREEMTDEIEQKRSNLFNLWSQLEKKEQEMYSVEQDCKLLIQEYVEALEKARDDSNEWKLKIYEMEQCTYDELQKYLIYLGNLLSQSEQSKKEIEMRKKEHPWVAKFAELAKERAEIIQRIEGDISNLKSHEKRAQSVLTKIDSIEKEHKLILRAVNRFDFQYAYSLLGNRKYTEILNSAGLAVVSDLRGETKIDIHKYENRFGKGWK